MSEIQDIAELFQQTLQPASRKYAESILASLEAQPGFVVLLLRIVQDPNLSESVRISSGLYFKNFVKKHWKLEEDEVDHIPQQDRIAVKQILVSLMISVPHKLQLQLSEAISIIADTDFPENWQGLVQELVTRLSPTDFNVNNGILQTAHSIFKRWRSQFATTKLFTEIKFVLEQFCAPFLQLFQTTDALIEQNRGSTTTLSTLFTTLLLLTKIFYSLNSQDLPEFFEDHMDEFLNLLQKYLVYTNALLETEDDEEAGPLEKVKASIAEIIDLYATRYEEEFTRLPQFVQTVWELLTATGTQPKYDMLVSKSIHFLTAVLKPPRHRAMFQSPESLKSICEKIILPNMELRPSDVEAFEDEPLEYIRRDLEGLDTDTRRRAASDLVRGLLEHFTREVTEIFSQYVTGYLQDYEKDKANKWKSKDTAIFLITTLSAKSLGRQSRATSVNEFIPIVTVYTSHILPELTSTTSSTHPIITLAKEQLLQVLPYLASHHLASSNYVVYTYASICVEKILGERDANNKAIFTQADVSSVARNLIFKHFELIAKSGSTPEKLAENDYLMKSILRIVLVAGTDLAPAAREILSAFVNIIAAVSSNPSNPKFNHYVFESIAALIRNLCTSSPALVADFENLLFPPFNTILVQDVAEFVPYVFQIMSQLLDLHAENGLPDTYMTLLQPLLTPGPWSSTGNIPALVRLVQSCLIKGAVQIVQQQKLQAILGIFHVLIGSKVNDHHGFELLASIFDYVPPDAITPYLRNVVILLMNRLSSARTAKFVKGFFNFVCTVFVYNKPGLEVDVILRVFDTVQPNLFWTVLNDVLLPTTEDARSPDERKVIIIGLTHLLSKSQVNLAQDHLPLWAPVTKAITLLLSVPVAQDKTSAEDEEELLFGPAEGQEEGAVYSASYSRLATVGKLNRNPVKDYPDAQAYFGQEWTRLGQMYPEQVKFVMGSQ
ncbi:hypothetical protein SmJEL517_g05491 [Synchytrium microbalum]|uniref:Importin N-terminal domain-containing protein n=1 Tax=Synchytrium microbalum TaxID=1806994 RepID=A0A507BKV7_9FUNG|nr:uncharacterized protein SmJEL517_g05491 [Synchytrium microbalum]TPX31070.1 hypothetical protein SmJEL517_g05491 [Synchytrium microbalum]